MERHERKPIPPIQLTDNDYRGKAFADVGITEENERNLRRIADINVSELRFDDHPNLFVFPPNIEDAKDEVGDEQICSIRGGKIYTGNVMGFVGIGNTQLSITSRFAQSGGEDYFLHYMLCRVLSLNVLSLNHNYNEQSIFDFLIYLFPSHLLTAYRQGLYKTYLRKQYNDSRVKGVIDVVRHIRHNIPFIGNVAYRTREMNYDNNVTQLVRHTIEYIESLWCGTSILSQDENVKSAVRTFITATPSYDSHDRQTIIKQNLRPIAHPYYTAYENLRQLCLMILRYDKLKYGDNPNDIYGILFDGAWLWEEYLNTMLHNLGFIHARNKTKENGIPLYIGHTIYPDFYKSGDFVIDAKYKGLDKESKIFREDLYQVVTYMYALKAQTGGVAFPSKEHDKKIYLGQLEGYNGNMYKFPLYIPQSAANMADFSEQIAKSENAFCEETHKYLEI